MSTATKHSRIIEHAAKAEEALAGGDAFEAERHAHKSLTLARQDHDFQRMVAVIPTLMEARLRRLRDAMKGVRSVTIIDTPVGDDVRPRKGCYMVQPPQVGADARRLRVAALERSVPVAVVCREPLTQIKLLPIVAISPGTTLRTKIPPPKNMEKPDLAWFAGAIEALGDFAIESLDAELTPLRRVDALLERLDALPEHEALHQALIQACVEAGQAEEATKAARAAKKAGAAATTSANRTATASDDDHDAESDEHALATEIDGGAEAGDGDEQQD
jgi:hypothetical protein